MAFEIEGTLVQKFPVASGTSARGQWKKQECVIEYQEGKFPQKLAMSAWGDDVIGTLATLNNGSRVKVSFDLSSREFQGRWYTDVKIWKLSPAGAPAAQAAPVPPQVSVPEYAQPNYGSLTPEEDDLPF